MQFLKLTLQTIKNSNDTGKFLKVSLLILWFSLSIVNSFILPLTQIFSADATGTCLTFNGDLDHKLWHFLFHFFHFCLIHSILNHFLSFFFQIVCLVSHCIQQTGLSISVAKRLTFCLYNEGFCSQQTLLIKMIQCLLSWIPLGLEWTQDPKL